MAEYEYRAVEIRKHATTRHTHEVLGIHAEYGGWELAHHAVYPDGRRRVLVRRRVRPEPQPPLAS